MEESCYSEIELSPNPNLPDGGIGRGFGWLFKYWVRLVRFFASFRHALTASVSIGAHR